MSSPDHSSNFSGSYPYLAPVFTFTSCLFSCRNLMSHLCFLWHSVLWINNQPTYFAPSSQKLSTLEPVPCLTPALLKINLFITPTTVLSLCSVAGSSCYRTLTESLYPIIGLQCFHVTFWFRLRSLDRDDTSKVTGKSVVEFCRYNEVEKGSTSLRWIVYPRPYDKHIVGSW